jgi:hypothetical protein
MERSGSHDLMGQKEDTFPVQKEKEDKNEQAL